MADLEPDIVGRVMRLPLKPSETNALLPLHEAFSNALHAVRDRPCHWCRGLDQTGTLELHVFDLAVDIGVHLPGRLINGVSQLRCLIHERTIFL
jgi:hypothetical protein